MPKLRRAVITTPAVTGVKNVEWNKNDAFNRQQADDSYNQNPVKTKKAVSGSFELEGGAWSDLYNDTMVMVGKDASAAAGVETITSRTHTFTEVTTNSGMNADNDSGAGGVKISFEATTVTST